MSDATYAPPVIVDGVQRREPNRYRHPSDVARLVFALILIALLLLLETIAPLGLFSVTLDILSIVNELPPALRDGLVGLVQFVATLVPVVAAIYLLIRRRFSLLFILALAAALAAITMSLLTGVVDDSIPVSELGFETANSWFVGSQYPSSTYVAALTAMLVAASPTLPRAWRVGGWLFIVAVVFARILSATEVPFRVGLLLAIGAAAGSAALLIFGAPRRRIDTVAVSEALSNAGIDVTGIDKIPHEGSDPLFVAHIDGGGSLGVKVLGRDQRDTDLLLGMWRALTVKGLGDSGAIRSPIQAVEREALTMAIFDEAGAATPRAVAVMSTPDEAAVLATTEIGGVPLARLGRDDVSDGALRDAFRQIALLQKRRLAHRSLNAGNVIVDVDRVVLITMRRSDLQATDEILGADVAELLVACSLTGGVERAVDAARRELTEEELARAVPLVQRAVFTRVTQKALDELDDSKGFLEQLRDAAAEAADVEHVELTPIRRITVGGVVSLVGSLVLLGYVLSLAADWDKIWNSFTEADLSYLLPILALAMAPYFTGALSMLGAVPIALQYFTTTAVMFGQSFLNRFTPANSGGMAMRIRYLQLSGLDATVAATSIGLTSAATGVAQGLMIIVFLFWGGASDRFDDFQAPDIGGIVITILIIGLVVGIAVMASKWGRQFIVPWLKTVTGKILGTVRELAKNPRKMTQLFGGAILGKLANVAAFYLSLLAFGVDISFPKAGALYMVASTIGAAVPTPGGVGGIEAALTAALVGYGVDNATAAAAVLFFRILTFWLPTLPGWGFLQYTQRKGIV
jgi:undecaprenyl-diphosphatase